MNKTTRIIVSIIALVFMTSSVVFTSISLYNTKLLNGAIMYIGLATGVVAIGMYLIIMRDKRIRGEQEAYDAARSQRIEGDQSTEDDLPALVERDEQSTEDDQSDKN